MKIFALFFCLLLAGTSWSQDTLVGVSETSALRVRLGQGETADLGAIQLKFVEVITDSRCPKNVQCIWAGEAIVAVELFRQGKSKGIREIKLDAGALPVIYNGEDLLITAQALEPYPVAGEENQEKKRYCLLLTVE
ncbi:hypothetical protein [Croceiramulus getboli]|nr:hypothetical protein P8624_04050 [Flavobacteriaceae bacterium YJPT1-3]